MHTVLLLFMHATSSTLHAVIIVLQVYKTDYKCCARSHTTLVYLVQHFVPCVSGTTLCTLCIWYNTLYLVYLVQHFVPCVSGTTLCILCIWYNNFRWHMQGTKCLASCTRYKRQQQQLTRTKSCTKLQVLLIPQDCYAK